MRYEVCLLYVSSFVVLELLCCAVGRGWGLGNTSGLYTETAMCIWAQKVLVSHVLACAHGNACVRQHCMSGFVVEQAADMNQLSGKVAIGLLLFGIQAAACIVQVSLRCVFVFALPE